MVEWITTDGLTDYREAEDWMEARVAQIAAGEASECIWLVEHPPLYTSGTSAKIADLTDPDRFPVYDTKRGGQYTYHGPGQRVWVEPPDKPPMPDGRPAEDKIAAIGIRLRKWISFHGISINVEPDLSHFDGIVPCGITDHGVTSLVDLGLPVTMDDVDVALRAQFDVVFGAPAQACRNIPDS